MPAPNRTLENLSVELLDMILEFLPRSDLVSAALSSKHLLLRVQPMLYREIEITRLRSVLRLWRTFLRHPSLALFCRKANIFLNEYRDELTEEDLRDELPSDDACLSPTAALVINPPTDRRSSTRPEMAGLDLCFAYILDCLANVRLLEVNTLTAASVSEAFGTSHSASRPGVPLRSFEHVRKARIVAKKWHRLAGTFPAESQDVLSFLNLAHLQRLEVCVFSKASTIQRQLHTTLSSELRELVLSPGSYVTFALLGCILERTPKLETLEYHFTAEAESIGFVFFESNLFVSHLSPVRQTLRHLSISCTIYGDLAGPLWLTNESWGFKGQLASLEDFTELRSLVVPVAVLLGYYPSESQALNGKLPAGLKTLRVLDDGSDFDDFEWMPPILEQVFGEFLSNGCPAGLLSLELNSFETQDWPWIPSLVETLQQLRPQTVVQVTHIDADE